MASAVFFISIFSTYPVIKIIDITGLNTPSISKVFIDKLLVSLKSAPANRFVSDRPNFIIKASKNTTQNIGKTPNTKPKEILLNFVLANPIFEIFVLPVINKITSVTR